MKERDIEDIIVKYPNILEEGLILKGRQVNVKGKYIDLLFEDKFGQNLIVELKRGTILRKHIGQIMDYEGHILSSDDPSVRVMLVGNRVPENLRRSLDHHGFEWKELSFSFISQYLEDHNDDEILSMLAPPEAANTLQIHKKEMRGMNNPLIDKERWSFWNELIKKANNQIPLNFKTPSKPQAVYASAGKTGIKWVFSVKKDEAWVELEIMLPGDKIKSHRIFSELYSSKGEIEKKYHDKIRWEKIDSRKSCRIQTTPREEYGIDDDSKWDELQEILIAKMIKLFEALNPYIQKL